MAEFVNGNADDLLLGKRGADEGKEEDEMSSSYRLEEARCS